MTLLHTVPAKATIMSGGGFLFGLRSSEGEN